MDDLLKTAIEAHGGLNTWNQFESLHASVSVGGALWDQKQLPGLFNNSRIDLKLRQQQVITLLPDIGERIVFAPDQVSLESGSETRLETRVDPRSSFAGQSADPKWDKLQAGYFCSYALRVQYSYFGEDRLLRRHLYTVDVLGGAAGANYAFEYRTVEGVMLPTRRRVFAYDANRQRVPEPVLISIDLSEIHFE